MIDPSHAIRIARPSSDLAAAERFYCQGLGLDVLYRGVGDPQAGTHDLLMVGPYSAQWHLELTVGTQETVLPTPTTDDLLVIYLGAPVSAEVVDRAAGHGGRVVAAHNPYWDERGVTLVDPDGYRLVLTERRWEPNGPIGAEAGSGGPS